MKPLNAVAARKIVAAKPADDSWCAGLLRELREDRLNLLGSFSSHRNSHMPVEIEAKLKVESHDVVREQLRAAGAKETGRHLEINTFFDTEDRSLLAADKGLRLRVSRDEESGAQEAIVTFKGPRQPGQLKSREETETHVTAPECMAMIFRALGFAQVLSFEKKRESWELDSCKIELDELPHLGTFVEIEGESEAAITAVQEKLGLSERSPLKASYIGMLMTWLQDRGSSERIVTFPR